MAETKMMNSQDVLSPIIPKQEVLIEEYSHEKPFLTEENELTDHDEECSHEGMEDDSLGNKSENVFVPIQTEIFLSDTVLDDDVDDNAPAGVDPLEVNDPTEADFKLDKVGRPDLPVTEVLNAAKEIEGQQPMNIKIVKVEHLVNAKPEFQRTPVLLTNTNAETVIRLVKLNFVKNVPPLAGSSKTGKSRLVVLPLNPNYEIVKYKMDDGDLKSRNSTQRTLYRCKRCRSLFPKLIQVQRHVCSHQEVSQDSYDLGKVDSSKSLGSGNRDRLPTVDRRNKKRASRKAKVIDAFKEDWKTQLTCVDCGKKFSRKANLTVHMISHSIRR